MFFLHICLTIFCTFPAANRKYVFFPAIISVFCIPNPLSIHHQSTPCVCDSSVSPIPPCSKTQRVMGFVGGKTIRVKINSLVFRPTQTPLFPSRIGAEFDNSCFQGTKKDVRCPLLRNLNLHRNVCLKEKREEPEVSINSRRNKRGGGVFFVFFFLESVGWR